MRRKRSITPKKPVSSAMTERMKSLSEKGRKRYFWRERKRPVPKKFPFPKA